MKFQQFGKYTILKKLAGGGMAEIFLACDLGPTGIGRFLVIKKALAHFSKNEEFMDMFKNEGKVACNLKHGNIAPIYEFGIETNQMYLSMEYISGRNLRELIKKAISLKTPLDIPYSVYMVKEVAAGLNYAHNAVDATTGQPLHLIHRDVSPQNIMISFDGEVKIIDFGIAKIADTDLTKAGHLKGKFGYMSPEQARGESLDPRTDIFCLGIILWELLANKRLFKCENEMSTLRKVQSCHIPNLQEINPQVPSSLNKIVMKILKKNKNLRYKTALDLERDLNKLLAKAYPEFDRYDFSAFIKKAYAKEILSEREILKKYHRQFKEYMKIYFEQELSYETHIDPLKKEKGFNTTVDATSTVDPSSEKVPHTQTDQPEKTGSFVDYMKKVTKSLVKSAPTVTYDNSVLPETADEIEKDSLGLSITIPGQGVSQTGKVIVKGGASQISHLLTEQDAGSYSLHSISASRTDSKNEKSAFFLYKKTLILPLIYIGLSIGICVGVVLAVKNVKNLANLPVISGFFQNETVKDQEGSGQGKTTGKVSDREMRQTVKRTLSATSAQRTTRPAPSQKTDVFVRTKPSGAMVQVVQRNNKFTMRTPGIIQVTESRPLTIKISKKGYHPYTIKVQGGKRLPQKMNIDLKRRSAASY